MTACGISYHFYSFYHFDVSLSFIVKLDYFGFPCIMTMYVLMCVLKSACCCFLKLAKV